MRFGLISFTRLARFLLGRAIKGTVVLDHRLYMRLYVPYLRRLGVQVDGTPIYISPRAVIDSADYSLIRIGDRSVISSAVRILTHDFSIDRALESHRGPADSEYRLIRPVTIGARAFVGAASILMPGSTVGDGSIVGAGSVVRGDIPANRIVVGNPATVVGPVDEWAERTAGRAEVFGPSVPQKSSSTSR